MVLGNGDGTFQSAQTYPVGGDPQQAVFGDFNHDGRLDIASVSSTVNNLSILLANMNEGVSLTGITPPSSGMDVTATYSGDTVFAASTSNKLDLPSVGPAAPGATLSTSSLTFAAQAKGTTSAAQTVTLTNSGTAALSVTSITASGDFAETNSCKSSLAVGANCTISVTFSPTVAGSGIGKLTITDSASGSIQTVNLSGTGVAPAATLSPTSLTFAAQATGSTSAAQTVSLTNGGTAPLAIASISVSGDFAESNTCGSSVAVGASCTIAVTFTPTAAGSRSGTLTIIDNASGSPQMVAMSGTGLAPVPAAVVSPASLAFAAQMTGSTSSVQTVTLTNPGLAALTLSSIVASGDFAQTNTCGSSVAAGAGCSISVTFAPTASGSRTGTLTITDNATGSPQTVNLGGAGTSVIVSTPSTGITVSSQGGSTTAAIQVQSADGFAGNVNLNCSVAYQGQGTPTNPPTCSLNPSQATVASGATVSTILTVSTTAASSSALPGPDWKGGWKTSGGVLAAMLLLGLLPRRPWRGIAMVGVLCLVGFGAMTGCGGSGSAGGSSNQSLTTTGSYTVTVTATSGTVTASTTIPLSVQ